MSFLRSNLDDCSGDVEIGSHDNTTRVIALSCASVPFGTIKSVCNNICTRVVREVRKLSCKQRKFHFCTAGPIHVPAFYGYFDVFAKWRHSICQRQFWDPCRWQSWCPTPFCPFSGFQVAFLLLSCQGFLTLLIGYSTDRCMVLHCPGVCVSLCVLVTCLLDVGHVCGLGDASLSCCIRKGNLSRISMELKTNRRNSAKSHDLMLWWAKQHFVTDPDSPGSLSSKSVVKSGRYPSTRIPQCPVVVVGSSASTCTDSHVYKYHQSV